MNNLYHIMLELEDGITRSVQEFVLNEDKTSPVKNNTHSALDVSYAPSEDIHHKVLEMEYGISPLNLYPMGG